MNRKKRIITLLIPAVFLVGAIIYFAARNIPASQNQPTDNQADTFISQSVSISMRPDAQSFNLTDGTFSARDLESGETIKIATDNSTEFYKIVHDSPAPGDYFDFQGLHSLMENWVGPDWRFTLEGSTQRDGSIMASKIFYTIQ